MRQTTITVPKNNGTATVSYSSLDLRDGRVYLITAMVGTNNSWRYAGVLFIQSTRTLLSNIETSTQLTVTADNTKLTFTNTNASYDAPVIVQAVGY